MRMIMTWRLLVAAAGWPSVAATVCNLSAGTWSNSKTKDIGHIEFDQYSSGSVLVHSAHWGNQVGWGTIYPNNTLDIHMVGASSTQRDVGPVTSSPYPNFRTKEPAPPCTYWHSGAGDTWCMFPFCPVAEPAWEPLPRPLLPHFPPTWNVARSTIIQPCNSSGFMDPSLGAAFGIVSFDYNNGRAVWEQQAQPACEEMSVEQCRMVKAVRNDTHCWVYRNTELAFAALTTDRRVMSAANASLFIHFKNQSGCAAAPTCPPKAGRNQDKGYCCPFDSVYEEGNPGWGRFTTSTTPANMRLYLWDYRNPAAVDYLVQDRILGDVGLSSPFVNGFFTDDPAGLGQEHPLVLDRLGFSAAEITACRTAQTKALRQAQEAIVERGGFNWQLLTQVNAVTNTTCLARMRSMCSPPRYQTRVAWQMNVFEDWQSEIHSWPFIPDFTQRFAAFLLARGPYAWFGYGFAGCDFPIATEFLQAAQGRGPLSVDLGEPQEDCHEISNSGVFTRRWSSGKTTSLDCNSWTATIAAE